MPLFYRIAFYCISVALFLGLPLLGWGIQDVQGFFANPARAAYAGVIVVQSFIVAYMAALIRDSTTKSGDKKKEIIRQRLPLLAVRLSALGLAFFLPFADRRDIAVMAQIDSLRILGVVLYASGVLWTAWSTITLGKQFSVEVTIQDDHELITKGPYRFCRHPRYQGLFMLALGITLVFHSWVGVAVLVPLLGLFVYRVKDEEAMLHREFGEQWEAYCKHSYRFIPFVY